MRKLFLAGVALSVSLVSVLLVAQERPDQQVFWKIRQEGTGQLPDHADAAHAHRRARSAAHRLTQPEGGGRVGDPANAVVGPEERPPRAVELRSSWLDERAARRLHRVAGQRHARRRSAGVDTGDERCGEGRRDTGHVAAAAYARGADGASRVIESEPQGKDRARQCSDAGAGDVQSALRSAAKTATSSRR